MGMRTGIRGTTGEGENGRGEVKYIMHMIAIIQAHQCFVSTKQLQTSIYPSLRSNYSIQYTYCSTSKLHIKKIKKRTYSNK